MELGISGRTALLTGADSGIGWHTAKELLGEGARVVLTDQAEEPLRAAAQKLNAPPERCIWHPADITSIESLEALRGFVEDSFGDIDILVQSAGITGAQGQFHEISDQG